MSEKKPNRLVFFDFGIEVTPQGQKEFLQITVINHIGMSDKPIDQKIIRLNEEQQYELLKMLEVKFKLSLADPHIIDKEDAERIVEDAMKRVGQK